MKRKRYFLIYPLLFMCLIIVFASSCDKDDVDIHSTFTDPRDNIVYKTVIIGNQVWIAENLKYLPGVVNPGTGSQITPYYYVYGYNGTVVANAKLTANYNIYGVLYNWEAAKAACPTGWHLPSNDEWTELTDFLGGDGVAGGKLKETDTTQWFSPNNEATNESGFSALPGGLRFTSVGGFDSMGYYGLWWSATESNTADAWRFSMSYVHGRLNNGSDTKGKAYSVRCVRDHSN